MQALNLTLPERIVLMRAMRGYYNLAQSYASRPDAKLDEQVKAQVAKDILVKLEGLEQND